MICPNHCNNGWIIDPYRKKREPCPYCKGKRQEEVSSGDVLSKLNLPKNFTNSKFEPRAVFPDYMFKQLSDESVTDVCNQMQELINMVTLGKTPDYSMLYNLGAKVIEGNFVNPLVLKAYLAGIKVVPVLDITTLCVLRNKYENDYTQDDEFTFKDYIDADLCVVSIDAGASYKGVLSAKGLMQLRAKYDKSTIFITHLWNRDVRMLLNEDTTLRYKNLATLYSVKYNETNHQSTQITGIRGGRLTPQEYNELKQHKNYGV